MWLPLHAKDRAWGNRPDEDSAVNALLMVLLLPGPGPSQLPGIPAAEKADNKVEAEEARAIAKKLAGEYVFQLDKSSGQNLRLEPEPVFRWLLQLDRRFYSDVYVWTHEGRPEVVAAITNIYGARRAMETEIHSLSMGLPLLLHGGKIVWEPERPGVELKPIPGAPKPGPTAVVRSTQMGTLAAQHSVVADYGNMKKEDMRLLPKPIYRYMSEKQGVTDGALFAFVRGTDPEAFLMIEARKGQNGVEWQYTFARFNGHCSLRAERDGREVWKVDALSTKVNTDPKQPYYGLRKYSDFPVVK
jgi:hypothetical protein